MGKITIFVGTRWCRWQNQFLDVPQITYTRFEFTGFTQPYCGIAELIEFESGEVQNSRGLVTVISTADAVANHIV